MTTAIAKTLEVVERFEQLQDLVGRLQGKNLAFWARLPECVEAVELYTFDNGLCDFEVDIESLQGPIGSNLIMPLVEQFDDPGNLQFLPPGLPRHLLTRAIATEYFPSLWDNLYEHVKLNSSTSYAIVAAFLKAGNEPAKAVLLKRPSLGEYEAFLKVLQPDSLQQNIQLQHKRNCARIPNISNEIIQ